MLPLPRRPIATALTLMLLSGAIPAVAEEDAVTRGEYLVHAGGCFSCHTVAGGEKLAGGRALATPFGTFYSPNITPDPETGIGRWTDVLFLQALREGVRPDGANYFPVFPYPSFTGITDRDALAIKAYLFSLPQCTGKIGRTTCPSHSPGASCKPAGSCCSSVPVRFNPPPSAVLSIIAVLIWSLRSAHCGECHTPRNFLGATRPGQWLAGTPDGPDGQLVPNITPDPDTGIGKWEKDGVVELLRTGTTPELSKVKGAMRETIDDGLKYLSDSDLEAIADYLFTQPPIVHDVSRKR